MAYKFTKYFEPYLEAKKRLLLLLVRLYTDGINVRSATILLIGNLILSNQVSNSRFINNRSTNSDDQLVQLLLEYESPGPYVNILDYRFKFSRFSIGLYASEIFSPIFIPGGVLKSKFTNIELKEFYKRALIYIRKIVGVKNCKKFDTELLKTATPIIIEFTKELIRRCDIYIITLAIVSTNLVSSCLNPYIILTEESTKFLEI